MAAIATRVRRAVWPDRPRRAVHWLRVLLPAAALALIGLVVLWPHLTGGYGSLIMPMLEGDAEIAGDRMRMTKPRYVGRTENAEPYAVTARSAELDPAEPDQVLLDRLDADLAMAGQRDIRLMALTGVYYRASEKLDLQGDIELTTSDGYRFETESAHVDLQAGRVVGEEPIAGVGPPGSLSADRFEILDGGEVLHFEGRVKVIIQPPSERSRNS